MSRAWAISEIRAAVFADLDVPSLNTAVRVCRVWHESGVAFLWRKAPAEALRTVKPGRRYLYAGAIGELDLSAATNVRRATRGWSFAMINCLVTHPNLGRDAAAMATLLARCGPKLKVVQFAMPPGSATTSRTGSAAPTSIGAVHQHDVRRYSIDGSVLQLLAQRAGLTALVAREATIPGSALAHMRAAAAAVIAPFAHLRSSNVCIAAADVPAFVALLPSDGMRSLGLLVDVAGATPAVREAVVAAVVAHTPRLRALRIYYNPMRMPYAHFTLPPPQAFPALAALGGVAFWPVADGDNIADDFRALRQLHELEALTVQGALFFMDAVRWRALLGGMLRLRLLTIGRFCTMPRDALVTAGQPCRQLRSVEIYSCVDFAAALDALATQPGQVLFPELRSVRVLLGPHGEGG